MDTITFEHWKKEYSTEWTHEDMIELYFGRMDSEMFEPVVI